MKSLLTTKILGAVFLPLNDLESSLVSTGNQVISFLKNISFPVAVIMTIVAAFIYMTSDRKADMAKEKWFKIFIAVIVIFAATSIITYVQGISNF